MGFVGDRHNKPSILITERTEWNIEQCTEGFELKHVELLHIQTNHPPDEAQHANTKNLHLQTLSVRSKLSDYQSNELSSLNTRY
jgi:hypothetical protein